MANARREAIRAVAKCHGAGIRAKMITGDHVLTARAFAAQIGLESSVEVITLSGRELETAERASFSPESRWSKIYGWCVHFRPAGMWSR